MDSRHLCLFATLANSGRISIREFNPIMKLWSDLKEAGYCTILKSGRAGTLVIHPTEKCMKLADLTISNLVKPASASNAEGGQ